MAVYIIEASPANVTAWAGAIAITGGTALSYIYMVPIADPTADNAPIINAALALPGFSIVMLPAGTIEINSPILGQSNRVLVGAGIGQTIIKAKSTFVYTAANNGVIFADTKVGFNVSDMTVEGNKVGWNGTAFTLRLNGIRHTNCSDYVVERVKWQNCSGYGCWPQGTGQTETTRTRRATYRDNQGYNCNVIIEPFNFKDITIDGLVYGEGDGDIPCEAAVHALVSGSGLSVRNVTGRGDFPGFNVVVSGGFSMDDITVLDSNFVSTVGPACLVLESQGMPLTNVRLIGSSFEHLSSNGTDIGGGEVTATDCRFKGTSATAPVAGLVVSGECKFRAVNCIAEGYCSFSTGQANGFTNTNATARAYFDGELKAVGTNGASALAKGAVRIVLSPNTVLTPTPLRNEHVFLEVTGQAVASTVSAGVSSILSLTFPAEPQQIGKAFMAVTLMDITSPAADINAAVQLTAGSPFVTVRLRGDFGGKTFSYYYREIF